MAVYARAFRHHPTRPTDRRAGPRRRPTDAQGPAAASLASAQHSIKYNGKYSIAGVIVNACI